MARESGGHWMVLSLQDWLMIVWSNDPSVVTSFFHVQGQPSWGIDAGSLWSTIRLTAVNGVLVQEAFLNQTSRNVIYLGEKPNQLPRTGLVFSNYSNVYPTDYAGSLIPTEQPAAKYAGLGDSYSAAEGNPSFEFGTDVDGQNECHRSLRAAYPRLLQARLELGATAFVACGGATLANILGGQWNEPSQLSVLSEETEKITLTAGGNDVGFKWYILGCTVACGPGTSVYSAMMDGINNPAFKANLIYTFEEILEAAPNADLYVADYPYLAAEDATTCQGLDFSGAYNVQEALNAVIGAAVAEVSLSSNRIFMVRTNYPGSPFEGKHLCNGGDPFFNGMVPWPNVEYSLHPDEDGHEAYADVFEEAIA